MWLRILNSLHGLNQNSLAKQMCRQRRAGSVGCTGKAGMLWVVYIRHENIHSSLPGDRAHGSLWSCPSWGFLGWFSQELQ